MCSSIITAAAWAHAPSKCTERGRRSFAEGNYEPETVGTRGSKSQEKAQMDDERSIHLRRLHGRLGELVYELTKVQFSRFSPQDGWRPAVNAYRCEECMVICADLAGVDRTKIDLQVEPRRLLLRGYRQPPEPQSAERKPVQVLVMEIDYGPFEREVLLPADVTPERVTAEQRNGLLWIYLPFQPQG
jgi:HSP20 family protein